MNETWWECKPSCFFSPLTGAGFHGLIIKTGGLKWNTVRLANRA